MNKKFYGLLFMSILILVSVSIPTLANHPWANYHWERSANPLALTIGDNMDSTWDVYLDQAIADWNATSVLSLTEVGPTGSTRRCSSSAANHVEVCNDSYGNTGWLGIAGISVSGDHITSAYAKMNDTYFNTAAYNTPEWRLFVTCQEIGHAFGLGHQDEGFDNANLGSCMDYTSDPDPDADTLTSLEGGTESTGTSNNLHLNSHDHDQLNSIYGHLDGDGGGNTGCNPKSPRCNTGAGNNGINSSDFNNPSEWGQLVRQNGRIAIYERDFGNGNSVLTVVIWADGHGH